MIVFLSILSLVAICMCVILGTINIHLRDKVRELEWKDSRTETRERRIAP